MQLVSLYQLIGYPYRARVEEGRGKGSGGRRGSRWLSAVLLGYLLQAIVIPESALAQRPLYRYQTESGIVVQGDRLPAGAAARGYSVLNSAGDVLQVVPRQLNDEERAERDRLRADEMVEENERERIRTWDRSLILRYSNLDDIDDAMRRGMLKYDTRIGILRGNLQSLKSQIESQQGSAANYMRQGRRVPEALTSQVSGLRSEVAYVEGAIVTLRQERVEVELKFHSDKERFEYLLQQAALTQR